MFFPFLINKIKAQLGQPQDIETAINKLLEEKKDLAQKLESLEAEKGQQIKSQLKQLIVTKNNIPLDATNAKRVNAMIVKEYMNEFYGRVA